MIKTTKLLKNTISFHKMALANYLKVKLAKPAFNKKANAALLSRAEEFSQMIKDESLEAQFDTFLGSYNNFLGALKNGGTIISDEEEKNIITLRGELIESYEIIGSYIARNSDDWEEDFDSGELIDLIQAIILDAGKQLVALTGGEVDLEELDQIDQSPGEFSDLRVDRNDKSLTYTGDKNEQQQEASKRSNEKQKQNRRFYNDNKAQLSPDNPLFIQFQQLKEKNSQKWHEDQKLDPEYRQQAAKRSAEWHAFEKKINVLERLRSRTRDPDEVEKLDAQILKFRAQQSQFKVNQLNKIKKVKELRELSRGEGDHSSKLEGMIQELTTQLNNQKLAVKNRGKKIQDYIPYRDAIAAAKESGDAAALVTAVEASGRWLEQRDEVNKHKVDMAEAQKIRDQFNAVARKGLLENSEYRPFVEGLVNDAKALLAKLGSQKDFNRSMTALALIIQYISNKIGIKSAGPIHFLIKEASARINVEEVISYVDSLGISNSKAYANKITEVMLQMLAGNEEEFSA